MKTKSDAWPQRTRDQLDAMRLSAADKLANAGRYQPLSLTESLTVRLGSSLPIPERLSSLFTAAATQARTALGRVGAPLWPTEGMLVPQPHGVAVLVVDMRGFSKLTDNLDDPQHLSTIINEYLAEMTEIVERDHGIVFQYTGDGLLGLFTPELSAGEPAELIQRIATVTAADMHRSFDELASGWRERWVREGRGPLQVGLGIGISYGRAALGLLGPEHKVYFGVVGGPVNLAAYLCSQARAGSILVDRASFDRTGGEAPRAKTRRLRSDKLHQRIDVIELRP